MSSEQCLILSRYTLFLVDARIYYLWKFQSREIIGKVKINTYLLDFPNQLENCAKRRVSGSVCDDTYAVAASFCCILSRLWER